ncbi:MAG: Crp/Fnr family transcriptional regulator, partial [Candidatus Baltobacteraceae bacterium]
ENEPRGLSVWLSQTLTTDVTFEPRRVGNREWHISLRRADGNGNASSPATMLKRCSAFRDLREATLSTLARVTTMHATRRGQTIVPDNGDWPFIGVVCEGVVALSSGAAATRARIFYEVIPYEIFGETEFFDRSLSFARTIVLSKTARYLRVPRESIANAGIEDPALLVALGRVCAQRIRSLAESLASQATQPILARIASVLIPYASPEQGLSPAESPLPNLTQAQIAASAGTVKEVAARAIADLESRDLLKRERGHIRFLDRQRLLDLVAELS